MHTFRTVAEAVATGYVLATHRVYRSYKECLIFGQDTGQMRLGGRGYGLRVEVPDVFTQNYLGVKSDRCFGHSVAVKILGSGQGGVLDVWSKRADGKESNVVQMFEPAEFSRAVADAQSWTNEWFRAHPEALEKALLHNRAQKKRA